MNGFDFDYEVDHYIMKFGSVQEADLIGFLYQNRDKITDFEIVKGSMDDVFLDLTGRRLGEQG